MRIAILGPAIDDKASGGVAVFDEGLYEGFIENGDVAFLISSNKSNSIDNITISKKAIKPNRILFHFRKIAQIIKKIEPDIVISSLQYSIGIKKYKRKFNKCKYIQVLHGFPCEINGKAKARLINRVAKFSKKHFDYVVTVSFLSYAINKKMNIIECDKVIYNGSKFIPTINRTDRPIDFIYIGRLFKDKEVEMIADSFLNLKAKHPKYNLAIAGYGELAEKFKQDKYAKSGINFIGRLSQNEVREILSKSKFFISMNPLEPFGIVFSEALLSGCNIVTQSTAGCASLYVKHPYYHIADCLNASELTKRLEVIHENYHAISDEEMSEIKDFASYKRVAKEYKDLVTTK